MSAAGGAPTPVSALAPALPLPRTAPRPEPPVRSPRATEIVEAAQRLLETEGAESLTMRRLGEVLGIRAPSLYKHLPGKPAVETALIETALWGIGDALHRVVDAAGPGDVVGRLLAEYRRFALARPNLYRLVAADPIGRADLTPGLEGWSGEPFYRATAEPYVAQALWAAAHGTVTLELSDRFLPGSDLDRTWAALARAFTAHAGD
ncbi:WHG domain-containing protein [Frankia sp. Cpl3]|uniref:TetR/AcrR family transcriptional regulator n=1 Tax=Parafrankia colletiae TaxID=573497 RepID=UPI000A028071|nr:TetR/AcrR family transcriptional regulator [Parafrankia colletiae]MCK9905042.1 WHG domain-containing protein [Frankia sp. Cpl3]